MVRKLENFKASLKRIRSIKENYKKVFETEKKVNEKGSEEQKQGLNLQFFSISTGSNLKMSAVSPKNPSIREYEAYLIYFKCRIAMLDCDEPLRKKWLKKLQNTMEKPNMEKIPDMQEYILSQCNSMIPYLNSFGALQDLLPKNPRSGDTDEQDSIRLLSFVDRDKTNDVPVTHPSAFKQIKDSEKKKEQIVQKCNQKHPLYFFNNLGVLHLNTKKYSMAVFFLTKALK